MRYRDKNIDKHMLLQVGDKKNPAIVSRGKLKSNNYVFYPWSQGKLGGGWSMANSQSLGRVAKLHAMIGLIAAYHYYKSGIKKHSSWVREMSEWIKQLLCRPDNFPSILKST